MLSNRSAFCPNVAIGFCFHNSVIACHSSLFIFTSISGHVLLCIKLVLLNSIEFAVQRLNLGKSEHWHGIGIGKWRGFKWDVLPFSVGLSLLQFLDNPQQHLDGFLAGADEIFHGLELCFNIPVLIHRHYLLTGFLCLVRWCPICLTTYAGWQRLLHAPYRPGR